MDDQEMYDLYWCETTFDMARWDRGGGKCATSSPFLFGGRDRRVSSNLLIHPEPESPMPAPEWAPPSEDRITDTSHRFDLGLEDRTWTPRPLVVGGGLVVFVTLLAVSAVLLTLYLQDSSHLDAIYKEKDSLSLNLSHKMVALDNLKHETSALTWNLSSLLDTISSIREQTLSGLLLNQTEILQKVDEEGHLYQMELHQYIQLQQWMENINRSYLLIPQDSPLLQNCQTRDPGSVCPFCSSGWHFFELSCYLLSPQTRNWQDSLHWCRKQEAHLVVINSREEQEFLQKALRTSSWIGLSDRNMEGRWEWVDGTPYNSTPKFWFQKQPDNLGNEDCAVLLPGSMWNDDKCRKLYSTVCEYKAGELQLPVDSLHDELLGP